jgi:hypothetical protein
MRLRLSFGLTMESITRNLIILCACVPLLSHALYLELILDDALCLRISAVCSFELDVTAI